MFDFPVLGSPMKMFILLQFSLSCFIDLKFSIWRVLIISVNHIAGDFVLAGFILFVLYLTSFQGV